MYRLLLNLLLLGCIVWAGFWVYHQPGTVWISVGESTIAMPLWTALLGFLTLWLGFTLFVKGVWAVLTGPRHIRQWWRHWQEKRSKKYFKQAFSALTEGKFDLSAKYWVKSFERSEWPVLNYTGAAYVAQKQGDFEKRDLYLSEAIALCTAKQQLGLELVQAQFYLTSQQYESASALLHKLQDQAPKHPKVLSLLTTLYSEQAQWEALWDLLPLLKKKHILVGMPFDELQQMVCQKMLLQPQKTISDYQELWSSFPRQVQQNPSTLALYTQLLCKNGQSVLAEPLLRRAIRKNWDTSLVRLYGTIQGEDIERQLARAEGWLEDYPESSELLLACGRLCFKNQLWGKAERYFEASLRIEPRAETYVELGKLYEKLNKHEQSVAAFKKAATT